MKRFFSILFLVLSVSSAFGQEARQRVTITEYRDLSSPPPNCPTDRTCFYMDAGTYKKVRNGVVSVVGGGGSGSPGGSDTQVQYNASGSFAGITGATTNGTTLTLVAPILGTPASVTLTNATGLPPATGIAGWPADATGVLANDGAGALSWTAVGAGSVTSVSVTTANGVSGSVATATTTPAITLTLAAITPTSVTASLAGTPYTGTNTTDASSVQAMLLRGNRATVASNDEAYVSMSLANSAAAQKEVGRITWAIFPNTASSEGGRLDFSVMSGGTLAKAVQLSPADFSPSNDNAVALGENGALQWSDLFLGTGGIIGWDNSAVTITHSSNLLTLAGGNLIISTPGTAAGSVATIDGAQTLTGKSIAATQLTGTLAAAQFPALTGDVTTVAGALAATLATVNSNVGSFTNASITVNAKGLITAASSGSAPEVPLTFSTGLTRTTNTITVDQSFSPIWTGTHTFTPTVTTGNGVSVTGTPTSGSLVSIAASGTGAASNTKTALSVATSGANTTSAQTTYGAQISNTSTGTASTNVAALFTASGGTTNYAGLFTGDVRIGPNGATSPALSVVTSVSSAVTGVTLTGQADGTAPTLVVNSRTQGASALVGNGLAITADPAIAGSSNAGAAAGGSVTITSGAAARLTSGNANGGDINLLTGAAIGGGTAGSVAISNGSTASFSTLYVATSRVSVNSTVQLAWANGSTGSGTLDTILRRAAAATIAYGAADAATAVAQFEQPQSVASGTSNVAGADWTRRGSAGTGTGAAGKQIFSLAGAGSSGTSQNTYNPVLTLDAAASNAAGLTITGNASGSGVSLTASGGGTDERIRLFAKGSGNLEMVTAGGSTDFINTGNITRITPGTKVGLGNAGQFTWSSNSDGSASLTGLAYQANAVVRVTNGSTGAGSLVLGTSTVGSIGTSGVGVLAIANGTAPSSSPADEFQLYSADWNGAGTAAPFFRNEEGTIYKLGSTFVTPQIQINGGANISKVLTNTATLDFGNTLAQTDSDLTVTVTGAVDGDVCMVGAPNGSTQTGSIYSCWISATNTATVRFSVYGLTAKDPASGTFRVTVIQH